MTRKDTIIIAVVVNAALLIGLFVSAIKRDDLSSEKVAQVRPIALAEEPKKEIKVAQGDEIDLVLREFSKQENKEMPQKIDFAKELEAITKSDSAKQKVVATSNASGALVMKVKQGDALEKIARSHGVNVDDIMKLNSMQNTRLKIGQILKLPIKQTLKKPMSKPETNSEKYYTVKGGDNPWTIALTNNMQVEELLRLNNMDEEKAKRLRPGDKLKIK